MSRLGLSPDVHRAVVESAEAGRRSALAVVLRDVGSTPRKAGTKALIDSSGSILGTIGGGLVEAETQRLAVEAIRDGRPLVFNFALEGGRADDRSPLCGGTMRILVDPTAADHRAAYAAAVDAMRERRRGALVTAVRGGRPPRVDVQWLPAEAVPADLGFPGAEAVRAALAEERPAFHVHEGSGAEAGGRLEVLVEPLVPPPVLVIGGGGHVGQALALQAWLVGFAVVVIDDRPEFLDPALYPEGVVTRQGDIAETLAAFPIAGDTYVALVTRGHQQDRAALAACVRRPAAYVGMIGSRRKVSLVRRDLLGSGAATEADLGRVSAPIGLDIGAQTVPEIATSIVAQLIAVRRTGRSPRMPTA